MNQKIPKVAWAVVENWHDGPRLLLDCARLPIYSLRKVAQRKAADFPGTHVIRVMVAVTKQKATR